MVNKANMRLWVAALRSKKFKQIRGSLKRISMASGEVIGHCCLGVICELAIEHGVFINATKGTHAKESDSVAVIFSGSSSYLPILALTWLGIENSELGDIPISMGAGEIPITAVGANDNLGWDFEKIADEAEEYYKLLDDDEAGEQT